MILHLVIPGLLGPWPADLTPSRPVVPALEWLLARADVAETPLSMDAVLFQQFGLPVAAEGDLPIAAVTALADGCEPDEEWWLRADPVHLRPDVQGVLLVDARALAIEPVEAAALAAAFDQTFAEDGLQLRVPCPERWYLQLPDDPGLRTYSLHDAIGRDINPLLPYGPNKRRWHTLLTEAQMLFHAHSVNRARDERRQPMINGLWLWGGGSLPEGAQAPAAQLYADDRLTRGLARLANVPVQSVPENADAWQHLARQADSLIVLDLARYDRMDSDPLAWADHLVELERNWFAPCRQGLKSGQINALHLYGGQGRRYSLTGAARWRFWRRPRPVDQW
ncbi:MAG TPA: hypothetical protein DCS21_09040 [Gammaproteobacteria bacterium]|nr:hypothetical protein [Gammaproteobacteria bacterium]